MSEPQPETKTATAESMATWALILSFVLAATLFAYAWMAYKGHVRDAEAFQRLEGRVQALEDKR